VADAPPNAQRLSLSNLWLAPHRIAFFVATAVLLAVSLGWTWMLVAPHTGTPVVTALPTTTAHAFIFAAAYMPLYIAGFMFTAGPRWLQVTPPPAERLRWPLALHVGGIALLLAGTFAGAALAAFGALLLAIAWTRSASLMPRWCAPARSPTACMPAASYFSGQSHRRGAAVRGRTRHTPLRRGRPGRVAAAVWLGRPDQRDCRPPDPAIFTSNAVAGLVPWRPNWVLALLLAAIIGLGVVLHAPRIEALRGAATWLAILPAVVAGSALTALAVRWGLMQSLRGPSLRLLAMLHLAFAWLPLALLLAAADAGLRHTLGGGGLGLAPLHALTLGMLGVCCSQWSRA